MARFSQQTSATFTTRVLNLVLALGTSVLIARLLGPTGKGVYTLATLLHMSLLMFINFGIGVGTIYYVAQRAYSPRMVLGSNILISVGFGVVGGLVGLVIVVFFKGAIFPGVEGRYLFLALLMLPGTVFFNIVQGILLGNQKFTIFNAITVMQSALALLFVVLFLWLSRIGVAGALVALAMAVYIADVALFLSARRVAGGVSFRLEAAYLRQVSAYGIRAHLANVLAFLTYKVNVFIIGGLMNLTAVGYYSVAVAVVERLWLISQTAGFVLFPRVVGETDDQRLKEFTPIVARSVLLVTALGAVMLFLVSPWLIVLLYSSRFSSSIEPLQILLIGVVIMSGDRVVANDLSGRGRPMLNAYSRSAALAVNVALNFMLIPRLGIAGAAWASTIAYGMSFLITLILYCRISGNSWTVVVVPRRSDWSLYRRAIAGLLRRVK